MNEGGGVVHISYKEAESEKINVIFLLRFYVQASAQGYNTAGLQNRGEKQRN